jgi:hypothetical protein
LFFEVWSRNSLASARAPPHRYLPSNSFKHTSRWDFGKVFSGLDPTEFSAIETALIDQLIATDQWIEEKSNVLKK